jgi:hypothetical protein
VADEGWAEVDLAPEVPASASVPNVLTRFAMFRSSQLGVAHPLGRVGAEAQAGNSPRRATPFLSDQKGGKKSPLIACPSGALRCSVIEPPRQTPFATLRSDSGAESELEVRCAHGLNALCFSASLKGG